MHATVDAFGRPDARADRAVDEVASGDAWGLAVYLYSPLNTQRHDGRLCLLQRAKKGVEAAVRSRVAAIDLLPPETYAAFDPDHAMPRLTDPPATYLHIFAGQVPPEHRDVVALRLKQSEYRRGRDKAPRYIYTVELVAPAPVLADIDEAMHRASKNLGVPLVTTEGDPRAPGGYVVF